MKTVGNNLRGLAIIGGLIVSLNFVHAQTTARAVQAVSAGNMDVLSVLDQARTLAASEPVLEQSIPVTANGPSAERPTGTYWSLQSDQPPMPFDPFPELPVYVIDPAKGIFVVDDRSVDFSALRAQQEEQAQMQAMAMDMPSPGDGGGDGGTNSYTSNGSSFVLPDYGTNLWIAQVGISSGSLVGIVTNSLADISYEIQSLTDLAQAGAGWGSEGFILGSELTNWTPMSVAMNNRTNLFVRIKSWADSTGSGIPDWWWLQYFGSVSGDPYGNPAGDGWNNLQKFQNGMNPNVFYTPPTPQGLTVSYNANNNTASVSWQPSLGSVTGYTVTRNNNGSVTNFNFSAGTTSFTDTTQPQTPNLSSWWVGPVSYNPTYQVQAQYTGGHSSASSAFVNLLSSQNSVSVSLAPSGQDTENLVVSRIPQNTATIHVTRMGPWDQRGHPLEDTTATTFDIPVTSLTNGIYPLSLSQAVPPDGYAYTWWAQTIPTNGSPSAATGPNTTYVWMTPFYDGRVQLKQNLIFLLRAGLTDFPFQYTEYTTDGFRYPYSNPADYAYADIYHASSGFDVLLPFEENYLYRNFVFSLADVDSNGRINTGAGDSYFITGTSALILQDPPVYEFQPPTTNWTTVPALLGTNVTRWLCSYPIDSSGGFLEEIGVTVNVDPLSYSLASNARNIFGLPFLSAEIARGNNSGATTTLYAGGSTTNGGHFYPETAQPKFQTVEYDFWQTWPTPLPGMDDFSPTNTSQLMITSVGNPNPVVQGYFGVAGYAKLAVTNGYNGVYGYLGQYFDQAYTKDTNGVSTTNSAGILSAYGEFYPTVPGPAALVTMPDIDTGQRGTCTVYCVSVQFDKNSDGNIGLSFNGPDATSASSPDQIWANNDYDRGHTVDGSDFEQDDLGAVDIAKLPAYQQVPDCNYVNASGQPAIPSTRDLEDYFRLWTPGLSAVMAAMPTNYMVQLTLSGDAQIRIFRAYEASGGTNYLFDETIASNQIANSASLYVGLLTSSSPIILNNRTNEHFIFCGAHTGNAQVDLQILDGNQNVVADAPAYLQINDIKNMYERWTVGEQPSVAPKSVADKAVDGVTTGFQYTSPQDTNTLYILFVHGWNMETWEKDRYAEAAFKRLYWQGYKGRFGSLRWPTDNNFGGIGSGARNTPLNDPQNFDRSESNAWASATGLLNKLNDLNTQYPGHVYLMAHSMGNVVAGEALRLAGNNQAVNTYVAMQAAIASHAYDSTTPTRSLGILDSGTPNRYAQYYTNGASCYFNNSAGAMTYVNFYNTNDYALNSSHWQLDQNTKPDSPYGYNPVPGFFYRGDETTVLNFPANTYELFAYCDEARCFALGAQANVGGVFKSGTTYNQVDLHTPPYNFDIAHKYHSGQFRADNMSRWVVWDQVLRQMNLKK